LIQETVTGDTKRCALPERKTPLKLRLNGAPDFRFPTSRRDVDWATRRVLQRRRLRLNQLLHSLHKRVHRHGAFGFFLASHADVDFARFHFAVS